MALRGPIPSRWTSKSGAGCPGFGVRGQHLLVGLRGGVEIVAVGAVARRHRMHVVRRMSMRPSSASRACLSLWSSSAAGTNRSSPKNRCTRRQSIAPACSPRRAAARCRCRRRSARSVLGPAQRSPRITSSLQFINSSSFVIKDNSLIYTCDTLFSIWQPSHSLF